ncbi:MAG: hypothetical protein Q4G70_14635 [Pseudomonadota bacterium]|nr:hypothetical protein [Pseudomonadota bacterium]
MTQPERASNLEIKTALDMQTAKTTQMIKLKTVIQQPAVWARLSGQKCPERRLHTEGDVCGTAFPT